MTRMDEFQEGDSAKHWPADRPKMADFKSEDFWNEVFRNSKCLVVSDVPSVEPAANKLIDDLHGMTRRISFHFMQTITTTYSDPRHEGSFGLVLYALNIALSSALSPSNGLAEGRAILRTIVELFITLHYLAKEDKPTLWQQYRSYGIGQTKLALLKNLRAEDVPEFLSVDELELLANEDRWLEFEDIELGNWANTNLRKMSEASGVKDVYDKFYDWSSGFVHGQWGCVRGTAFTTCLNPLHRFHRVPAEPLQGMASVMSDICGLLNRMIDDLNSLYPVFKPRINAHKAVAEEAKQDGKLIETDFAYDL
ncbi:UNVERIFIED_ORG: hypothetical protein M2435_006401 [Rhizobium sophorae]|nr:hypothetical protein [Rhizobium leguminosarum]MDH6663456.1 hypothetical protein [Rhizobium sophorae]